MYDYPQTETIRPFNPNSPAGIYYVTCRDARGATMTLFAYFNPKTQQWLRNGEPIGFADRITVPGGPNQMPVVSMVNNRLNAEVSSDWTRR